MNNKNQTILQNIKKLREVSATQLSVILNTGLRTTQRDLNKLIEKGFVQKNGQGKNTLYSLSIKGKLNYQPDIDLDLNESRLENESVGFNFDIFQELADFEFDDTAKKLLDFAKSTFRKKMKNSSPILKSKEFRRLVVEFSWKSSKIEGDTYSLLDTENLLLHNLPNPNKTFAETQMILNHKNAFEFIYQNPDYFKDIEIKKIIELHTILTDKLEVKSNFRQSGVGIIGSLYTPLSNQHQIHEAVEKLCNLLNTTQNPYLKSMFSGLLLAYIQPFEDGNKRTSRVLANAILYSHELPLLSYRNTNIEDYRNTVIAFYELNSVYLYSQMFISQVEFFSKNYF